MTPAKAAREAEHFNARCPVGTPVRYWPGLRTGPGTIARVRNRAVVMSDHASVWVEGQASSINLSHVAPLEDRPVLFSTPMVRALLRGDKTQTRRILKLPRWAEREGLETLEDLPYAVARASFTRRSPQRRPSQERRRDRRTPRSGCLAAVRSPYGLPGDGLWVRETWAHRADLKALDGGSHEYLFAADTPGGRYHHDDGTDLKWRPSIFMPRAAARIRLEVTGVRAERLHDISLDDAAAEGMASYWRDLHMRSATRIGNAWTKFAVRHGWGDGETSRDYRGLYAAIWEKINPGTWEANPWVWVVTFRRTTPELDRHHLPSLVGESTARHARTGRR